MIRARTWLAAAVLTFTTLAGGCAQAEPAFCSDFRRIDKALGPLRDAKAQDDFASVPHLVDQVADAYEGIEPPAALRQDWPIAVSFFRQQAEWARTLLRQGQAPPTSEEEDARHSRAFTNIADYTVARCGGVRGQLVP